MRRSLLLLAVALGCSREDERKETLSARVVANENDLIGGVLAHGQVGDFRLENDQVRFIISGAHHSWGPGLFGGTVVDADLQRGNPENRGPMTGNDHFAELFPTVNLLVSDPSETQVKVTKSGADGKEAQISASGTGFFFLDGLALLDPQRSEFKDLLQLLDLKTRYDFETTYTLRPGTRALEIETIVRRPDSPLPGNVCIDLATCPAACEAYRRDAVTGCLMCECEDPRGVELPLFTESVPLLARILGDALAPTGSPQSLQAGFIGGDFLFFGGSTDVFAPGFGFDVKGPIFDNFYRGVDTITSPLTFDWVAARGKDISYAMYTLRESKPDVCLHRVVLTHVGPDVDTKALTATLSTALSIDPGRSAIGLPALIEQRIPFAVAFGVSADDLSARLAEVRATLPDGVTAGTEFDGDCRDPKVLVPLFTSSATMLAGSGTSCLTDPSDDDTCDEHRIFRFKRYLVVGDGDISSATAPIYAARGIPTGTFRGVVIDTSLGRAEAGADVFVLRDPGGTHTTYDSLLKANVAKFGTFGVENHAVADLGTDTAESGRYRLTLPEGSWYLVARSQAGVVGTPQRVIVVAGRDDIMPLTVSSPAFLEYLVTDQSGQQVPVKLTLQALGAHGKPLYADGNRRVEMGDGRFDDGVYTIIYSAKGAGREPLAPGDYAVTVSRGVEYSIARRRVTVRAGEVATLTASVVREVDTSGFIAGDFHLHAEPSMDAGIDLGLRVLTNVVEGVELISSSDHDSITDYRPKLLELGLERFATTQVGLEVSTLELGHTLAFPLAYDNTAIPVHGAVDWVCKAWDAMWRDARALGEFGPESTVLTVAHPRDGFLGYFDQFKLDPWTLARGEGGLEAQNPLFRTLSCDFDSIEVFNGKRFELLHTPTTSELNDTGRCLTELNTARTQSEVRAVCGWLLPSDCTATGTYRGLPCQWFRELEADLARCADEDSVPLCKDKARNGVTKLMVRRLLHRTPEEQDAWYDATATQKNEDDTKCTPAFLESLVACARDGRAADPAKPVAEVEAECAETLKYVESNKPGESATIAPCAQHQGVLEDWFQLLNFGLEVTAMGNSDSHGTTLEPGLPRNFVAAANDDPTRVDRAEVARNIKDMKVLPSTGPFVEVAISGKGMGETVTASVDAKLGLKVRVQTPSWFGVSRIEVYRNGRVVATRDLDVPASQVVDFDDTIEVDAGQGDAWFSVAVMGLDDEDFMDPVYVTVALGDLGLDKITSLAFKNLGFIGTLIGSEQPLPDYFPVIPYAITNPIFVDVDGGGYLATKGPPPFCPVDCEPGEKGADGFHSQSTCPEGEVCWPNTTVGRPGTGGTCGRPIPGECGLAFVAPETTEGSLTAAMTVAPSTPPLEPSAQASWDEASVRHRAHAVGRYIWNAFVHGFHVHDRH